MDDNYIKELKAKCIIKGDFGPQVLGKTHVDIGTFVPFTFVSENKKVLYETIRDIRAFDKDFDKWYLESLTEEERKVLEGSKLI